MLRLGDDIVPKAIYGGIKVYNSPGIYVEPSTKILAHLTLSDGSIVDIEDDDTGVLKRAMISAYSATTVSVEITTACTTVGQMAFVGNSISNIYISESVTTLESNAFRFCSGLTSIDIPNSVTTFGEGVFSVCSALTSVNIQSTLTSIPGSMFYGCHSLTSFNIQSGVTSIGQSAFEECSGLTSVTIPSNVTSIDKRAFYNCRRLTSVTVEATTPPTMGIQVFNNTNNCPIYVPAESVDAYKTETNWSSYASRIQAIH